jgi:hypothetical protein
MNAPAQLDLMRSNIANGSPKLPRLDLKLETPTMKYLILALALAIGGWLLLLPSMR